MRKGTGTLGASGRFGLFATSDAARALLESITELRQSAIVKSYPFISGFRGPIMVGIIPIIS